MRNSTLTVLAVAAILLLAAGGVTAHDNDGNTTGHDDAPVNGSAADWAAWMEQHMTEHVGADAATQMQDRMGMNYEEMGEHMAARHDDSMMDGMMNGRMLGGMMNGGTSGMGCH